MIKENNSISMKATLQEAMDLMNEYNQPALLVTETVKISDLQEDQILKGLLTMNDIIRAWQKSQK